MIKRRRPLILLLAGVSALAVAGFLLALASVFLSAASLASANRPHATAPVSAASAQPLRWSGIESPDRATYAANLRGIGCPEATINAILDARFPSPSLAPEPVPLNVAPVAIQPQSPVFTGAAVNAVAAPALQTTIASAPADAAAAVPSTSVAFSGAAVAPSRRAQAYSAAGMTPMARARAAMMGGSIGFVPAAESQPGNIGATNAVGETAATPDEQTITAPVGDNIAIPAAFQVPGPDEKLNDTQKAGQDQLQQQFVNQIGGPDQNPADRVYQQRWQTAQWKSDQQFRAFFGQQAWLDRQAQENKHKDD